MSEQEQYQLDGSAPELYERYLVPAVTAVWAADLIERAGLQAGQRVLDVACGSGIVTRLAAAQVGETGRVAGLDINAGMLEMARSLQPDTGASIEWHHNDVVAMPFPVGAFDVALQVDQAARGGRDGAGGGDVVGTAGQLRRAQGLVRGLAVLAELLGQAGQQMCAEGGGRGPGRSSPIPKARRRGGRARASARPTSAPSFRGQT